VTIWQKSYIHLDGLKCGNSSEHVYHLLYAHNLKITRCAGFDAGGALDPTANFHIFEIAYSDSAFAEDIWGWGTGRYTCTFYGCSNSHIRRGVFRPGLYQRCPHAGLAIYCTDNSLAENVIVFEARVDPNSTYGGTEPWKLITGGFVCEGHDCPNNKSSKGNRHLGCIGIDNGEHWDVTPRSQPAGCFIWNEYQGTFEDMVLWKNPDKAFAHFTGTSTLPTRSLEGDPDNIIKNTNPNIHGMYMNGTLTRQDLWPWPYEDLIKADMGMDETITEYVRRQLDPFIVIATKIKGKRLSQGMLDTGCWIKPNPFSQVFTINYAEQVKGTVSFMLYNSQGKLIHELVPENPAGHTFDASYLAPGLYFLKIKTGQQISIQRLLKM
jgi:hypothetical protein